MSAARARCWPGARPVTWSLTGRNGRRSVVYGLGRIGRAAPKIPEQAGGAEVVAVNDLVPPRSPRPARTWRSCSRTCTTRGPARTRDRIGSP